MVKYIAVQCKTQEQMAALTRTLIHFVRVTYPQNDAHGAKQNKKYTTNFPEGQEHFWGRQKKDL